MIEKGSEINVARLSKKMTMVVLTLEMIEAIDTLRKRNGETRSTWIRTAITEKIKKHER